MFSCRDVAESNRPRSTMDSIRVSEAPDTGSIPVEATFISKLSGHQYKGCLNEFNHFDSFAVLSQ